MLALGYRSAKVRLPVEARSMGTWIVQASQRRKNNWNHKKHLRLARLPLTISINFCVAYEPRMESLRSPNVRPPRFDFWPNSALGYVHSLWGRVSRCKGRNFHGDTESCCWPCVRSRQAWRPVPLKALARRTRRPRRIRSTPSASTSLPMPSSSPARFCSFWTCCCPPLRPMRLQRSVMFQRLNSKNPSMTVLLLPLLSCN